MYNLLVRLIMMRLYAQCNMWRHLANGRKNITALNWALRDEEDGSRPTGEKPILWS